MSNEFYIRIEDDDGVVPGAGFYAYPTYAAAIADATWVGTGKVTLIESQPITTDSHGEATVHHATLETLYIRALSSPDVTGVRSSNVPLLTTYPSATPTAGDTFIFSDATDEGLTKSVLYETLLAALTAAVLASGTLVTGVGTSKITVSASDAGGGVDGDIWVKVV